MFPYNYAAIQGEHDGFCYSVVSTPRAYRRGDLVPLPGFDEGYLKKFYHHGRWWERSYEQYGENGLPAFDSPFTERPWEPSGEEVH